MYKKLFILILIPILLVGCSSDGYLNTYNFKNYNNTNYRLYDFIEKDIQDDLEMFIRLEDSESIMRYSKDSFELEPINVEKLRPNRTLHILNYNNNIYNITVGDWNLYLDKLDKDSAKKIYNDSIDNNPTLYKISKIDFNSLDLEIYIKPILDNNMVDVLDYDIENLTLDEINKKLEKLVLSDSLSNEEKEEIVLLIEHKEKLLSVIK